MKDLVEFLFEVQCPFGGSGGGALGFLDAEVRLLGHVGRFTCRGSVDFDRVACADFERFTGSTAHVVDVEAIARFWAPWMFRAVFGARAPHVVFMSPPCKGASRLLSAKKAASPKYEAMNRLALTWTKSMLEAWGDSPPALILLENVPGLPTRARAMLEELRALLRDHGYVLHESAHDCGELGGLAQHRQRYLLVARHPEKCPPILYQPPKRRVRGCGEVLEQLPMPATEGAARWGALHELPRITWRNWLRLALIPAGGDWRDLDGVLREDQARREVHRRHAVEAWDEPTPTITGNGGHAVGAVADPRVSLSASEGRHWNKYSVHHWDAATKTVIGRTQLGSGRPAVADPRALACAPREGNWGTYGVARLDEPIGTVAGQSSPSNGKYSVADPRVRVSSAYDAGYGVLGWADPSRTIASTPAVGCGAYAVAEPRQGFIDGARFLTLDEAMELDLPIDKAPGFIPIIIARDGTWHRPLTLLELAALQSVPIEVDGEPVRFGGTRTQIAEHVGNLVPPSAARAIAEQMLVTLMQAELETFALSSGDVWVQPDAEVRAC